MSGKKRERGNVLLLVAAVLVLSAAVIGGAFLWASASQTKTYAGARLVSAPVLELRRA